MENPSLASARSDLYEGRRILVSYILAAGRTLELSGKSFPPVKVTYFRIIDSLPRISRAQKMGMR